MTVQPSADSTSGSWDSTSILSTPITDTAVLLVLSPELTSAQADRIMHLLRAEIHDGNPWRCLSFDNHQKVGMAWEINPGRLYMVYSERYLSEETIERWKVEIKEHLIDNRLDRVMSQVVFSHDGKPR